MGKLEDYYDEQDRLSQNKLENDRIGFAIIYNSAVDIINEVISKILENIDAQRPDTCVRLTIGNNRYIAWEIYECDYEPRVKYFLLSDGRIASTPTTYVNTGVSIRSFERVATLDKNPNPLSSYEFSIIKLKNSLVNFAVRYFGVNQQKSWIDIK